VFTFSDTLQRAKDVPHRASRQERPLGRAELLSSLRPPTGDYTEGGDAVLSALDALPSEKVSSVLLLSDGRNTGGEGFAAVADRARQAGVPVQTLTFGSERPLIDLRIDRVDAPAEASLGDLMAVYLRITNHVRGALKVQVRLFENGKLDQARTVTLAAGENRVTLTTIPRVEGLREYRVELPELPDEINYANNRSEFHVKVVKRTLRVLFVAGKATREYQHATLCMLRDPVIRMSCFLQSAHVDYVQQGNVVIDRLPGTVAQWAEYDVVLLYDVDPKKISSQQVSGLENTVSKGAGLLVMAGRSYGLGPLLQIHASKMRQLLPVEIDKNRPPEHHRFFHEPVTVERTPQARGSAVFRLVGNEQLNEQIWRAFPALYWYHPVVQVKPRAIATLRKVQGPAAMAGWGDCVMAVQRFGEGLVVYLGTDEVWRWRKPFGSHDYDLFWSHLIRYLGETRLLGSQKQVALGTDKRLYGPGEKVKVTLRILDHALLQQLAPERLTATVIDPARSKQVIGLQRDPSGLPAYRGSFTSRRVGPHLVEASHVLSTADTEAKPLYSARESFKVELVPLESLDTRADLEGMRKLAETTGGKCLDHRTMNAEALARLAGSIPAEKLVISHESIHEVWDTWSMLALVLVLVATEWSLRKYWGVL